MVKKNNKKFNWIFIFLFITTITLAFAFLIFSEAKITGNAPFPLLKERAFRDYLTRSYYLSDGEPCQSDKECISRYCNYYYRYNGQVCLPTNVATGGTCIDATQCQSQFCFQEQCLPQNLQTGDNCVTDLQCSSGLCRNNQCFQRFSSLEGTSCQENEECASRYCHQRDTRGFDKKCARPNLSPKGYPCNPTGFSRIAICLSSISCNHITSQCYLPRSISLGKACTLNNECSSQRCYQNRCINPLGNGNACANDQQCSSVLCVNNLCEVRNTIMRGQSCQRNEQCNFIGGDFCWNNVCSEGNYLNVGQACQHRLQCTSGVCENGICGNQQVVSVGQSCSHDYRCSSLACLNGVCIDPQRPGSSCISNSHCTSNICTNGICTPDNSYEILDGCTQNTQCYSALCLNNRCAGTYLFSGETCTVNQQCQSNRCTNRLCR